MIIANSSLSFSTSHAKAQTHREHESLVVQRFAADGGSQAQRIEAGDRTSLSDQAIKLAKDLGSVRVTTTEAQAIRREATLNARTLQQPLSALGADGPMAQVALPAGAAVASMDPPDAGAERIVATGLESRLALMAAILTSLTGKPTELFDGRLLQDSVSNAKQVQVGAVQGLNFSIDLNTFQPPVNAGTTGMRYEQVRTYSESERTTYSASGEIRTADGKRLQIDLLMEMQHSFSSHESTVVTAGAQLTDPLIISFAAPAAYLTDEKFGFDINSDGTRDQVSFAGHGSGFLALDRNGDGRINNGSELFGTRSGDGFADLAAYDEDGNGYIDEGDSVYTDLKIWVKTGSGADQLFSLADRDIGAIYLGAVRTPFEIKDDQNTLQGVVRSSSVFLREDGSSGTVQQVDLVV